MHLVRPAGAVAGVISLFALAAPAAFAAPVTVRVEGGTGPKVARAVVEPVAATFQKSTACAGGSAGAALETATAGNWGGGVFFGSQGVEQILGEDYPFGPPDKGVFWSFYVNDVLAGQGVCETPVQAGDEVLLFAGCGSATSGCYSGEPLDVTAPASARPGEPFRVDVREVTTTFGPSPTFTQSTAETPSGAATVTAAGGSFTTNAEGVAQVTIAARGPQTLRVTKGGRVPETWTLCVSDGQDGFCGSNVPPPPCATTGDDGLCGTVDRRPPVPLLLGFEDGERYAVEDLGREIFGGVLSDPSGIRSYELSIFRRVGRRCAVYSGRSEKFVKAACTKRSFFSVGDRETFSYLLPRALTRGTYEIAVRVTDKAANAANQRIRFIAR